MKINKYRLLTRILILTLLLTITGMVSAVAEQIIIVPVSDNRMTTTDDSGASLRSAIEAYTYASGIKGDNVLVLGSIKKNGGPVYVYSPETGIFQWENGDEGNDSNYFRYSLAQLNKIGQPYDRAIVLSGHLQNAQNPNKETFDTNTQFILYRSQKLAKNNSLVALFGNKLRMSAEADSSGFAQYGNVMVKELEDLDSLAILKDLLGKTYSGSIRLSDESGLTIPEKMSTNNVLVIIGSGIEQTSIIIDGERIIKVTTDPNAKTGDTWYSPLFTFGNREVFIISIPENTSGNLKISGAEGTEAYLYYTENPQFGELVQQIQLCPDGMQYDNNDTVRIALTGDQTVKELRMLYPEASFQATFTPIDASYPFTIYENGDNEIVWKDINNVKTQILVSLKETRDGKDIVEPIEFTYTPVSEYIDSLQTSLTVIPDGSMSKRGKANITLSFQKDNLDNNVLNRVDNWLSQSVASLSRQGDSVQENMQFNPEKASFTLPIELPEHKGDYQWEIILSSGENYPVKFDKSYTSESIHIENHPPVCNDNMIEEKEFTRLMQPGSVAKIVLPKTLFTDPDYDPLTISYIITKDSTTYANGSYEGNGGISPEYEITDINDFGDWTIELTATDNDNENSQSLILKIHTENGNSAPQIDEGLCPSAEESIPLLRLSDYVLKIPRGLFTDSEGDALSIEGSLNYDSGDYIQFSYEGPDGISDSWETPLERFGTCTIQLKAKDQYGLESDTVTFKVHLEDALASLPGVLSSTPEKPQKGDNVKIKLTINWPKEYSSLNIREWLENSSAVLTDNNNTKYEMRLSNSTMTFETDTIKMPDQKTDLVFTVVVMSNEGNIPQKRYTDYQPLSISIDNSAPKAVADALENQTKFCFDLGDYVLHIPNNLFIDNEEDDFSITLSIIDEKGEIRDERTFRKDETPDIKMPDFGKWTVRLTAKDTEGLISEPFEYCTVTIHNLKLIVIIAGAGLLLIIGVVLTILITRHRKNLPRFHQSDAIQFKLNDQSVSEYINMPEGNNQQAIPLTTFAMMITTLITETQWNNMKQWSICPTHDEKPVFRKNGTKTGGDHKADLGEGLSVEISNGPTRRSHT